MRVPGAVLLALALALFCCTEAPAHPLDPLSPDEIEAALAALRQTGDVDADTRFPLITLDEPEKPAVLAWAPGQPFARKAFVIARRDRTTYEGVIDLAARKVERWGAIPGVQPAISLEELAEAKRITLADPGWQAAMRKRGYSDFSGKKVFCAPMTVGHAAHPAEAGRRLIRVTCFDAAETTNVWSRPIEGLQALIDLDEKKMVRLIDTGQTPVSRERHDFGARPISSKPAAAPREHPGPFELDGNEVHWKNWSFHYRLDRRGGLIVSLVRYRDRGRDRLVLYRGSLAELFVPYMDPAPGWSFRTFMDQGENDFGFMASPLRPGADCPSGAAFLAAMLADSRAEPRVGKAVICLFERDTGVPLWRHAEGANATYGGRPAVELVLRTIESVGNYDYLIDWVLSEAGVIRIDVGATGIDAVKGVAAGNMAGRSAPKETATGALVAPNLVAVNHDHFLSFRLDLDIDGQANTLVRQRLEPQPLDGEGGRRSFWTVAEAPVLTEGPIFPEHGAAELWRIINPNLTNALGQHPGYELRPGHSAVSLLAPDDIAQRRAAFSAAPLWITAYDPRELYAAGPYPNQSRGGDGLPAYVAQRRPVENADLVLWCTMGFHHLPRPEDWPVLPTMRHSLALVPYGFFDRTPAIEPQQ
jgi:primary-amine oxidase